MRWPTKTQSDAVQAVVDARIGTIAPLLDATPLSGALVVAAVQAISLQSEVRLDEEALTACLLGEIDATIPWFAEQFVSIAMPEFDWDSFAKNAKGNQGESFTGADFSIVIKFSGDFARAAIFQAKKSKDGTSFKVHQISPARGGRDPEPQLLRLLAYGRSLLGAGCEIADLHWVHYCGYGPDSAFCRPLSGLAALIGEYETLGGQIANELEKIKKQDLSKRDMAKAISHKASQLWADQQTRDITRISPVIELPHLLELGAATPPPDEVGGWLTLMGAKAIGDFRRTASKVMPVVIATSGHGLEPTHEPSGGASIAKRAASVVDHLNDPVSRDPDARPQLPDRRRGRGMTFGR